MISEKDKLDELDTMQEDDTIRRIWRKPVIKRMDIKRTMFGNGPYSDTFGQSTA